MGKFMSSSVGSEIPLATLWGIGWRMVADLKVGTYFREPASAWFGESPRVRGGFGASRVAHCESHGAAGKQELQVFECPAWVVQSCPAENEKFLGGMCR